MKATTTLAITAAAVVLGTGLAKPVQAAGTDADIMFVIDRSGSMDGEFDFLGGAMEGFINDLQGSPDIESARAGLIAYEGEEGEFSDDPSTSSEVLFQDLTSDAAALDTAFSGVETRGGTEDAFRAMDSAMPGGNLNLGASYREDAVKSLVLVTDEDPDDGATGSSTPYSNAFNTGTPSGDIQALLDENGFLNNIIREAGDWDAAEEQTARPSGALFEIDTFRNDREQFFADFTDAKIQEIEEVTEAPLPGTVALLGLGLLGLGAVRCRQGRFAAN